MKNWKRALLYITRKKNKSILMIGIIYTSLICVILALGIKRKSDEVIVSLEEKMSGYFTIVPNLNVEGSDERLTEEFCKSILKDENVLAYNGVDVYNMTLPDVELIRGIFSVQGDTVGSHTTTFISTTDSNYSEQFYIGELELVKGEAISVEDSGKILISEEISEINGLNIGDSISGIVTDGNYGVNKSMVGEIYKYTVKGIYSVKHSKEGNSDRAECDIIENYIYVDSNTGHQIIKKMRADKETGYRYGVNVYVKNSGDFEKTKRRIQEKMCLNNEAFRLEENNADYLKSADKVKQIAWKIKGFIIIATILSSGIFFLTYFLWMKERQNEIGIYIALGLEKHDVFSQLITESLLLYGISYVSAIVTSYIISRGVYMYVFGSNNLGNIDKIEMRPTIGDLIQVGTMGICVIMVIMFIVLKIVSRDNLKQIMTSVE